MHQSFQNPARAISLEIQLKFTKPPFCNGKLSRTLFAPFKTALENPKTTENFISIKFREPCFLNLVPPFEYFQEISKLETLDDSQRTAMRQALTQRVALVQGPPGTGKTFMGVQMCDIIMRCSSQKMLVVCQTNHALDQFMEALADQGITAMVRIGYGSESSRLEQYKISNLTSFYSDAESWRVDDLRRELQDVKTAAERTQKKIMAVKSYMQALSTEELQLQQAAHTVPQGKKIKRRKAKQQLQYRKNWQPPSRSTTPPLLAPALDLWLWRALRNFLESEHPAESKQLTVGSTTSDERFQRWVSGGKDSHPPAKQPSAPPHSTWILSSTVETHTGGDGVDLGTGQAMSGLVSSSLSPRGAPAALQNTLWGLSKHERALLLHTWLDEIVALSSEDLSRDLEQAERLCLELKTVHEGLWEAVLAGVRVIGCTTSGAAKYKTIIEQAKVRLM